jgi:hypothetical protein
VPRENGLEIGLIAGLVSGVVGGLGVGVMAAMRTAIDSTRIVSPLSLLPTRAPGASPDLNIEQIVNT